MPMDESCTGSDSGIAMASFSQDVKASKAMKNSRFRCGNFMIKRFWFMNDSNLHGFSPDVNKRNRVRSMCVTGVYWPFFQHFAGS